MTSCHLIIRVKSDTDCHMAHHDRTWLQKIRTHWQREQHLIRKKYRIPYPIVPPRHRDISAPDPVVLPVARPGIRQQKTSHYDSQDPPIYCSTCHGDLQNCACPNGISRWWRRVEDELSASTSRTSTRERRTLFNSTVTEHSSIARSHSNRSNALERDVLLDWNDRQSLLTFLRTVTSHKNLANLTLSQLQELISNCGYLRRFDSVIDLMLRKSSTHLHQIYIDRSYHTTLPGMIPFTHLSIIADNLDLSQALHATQILASRLTEKIDSSIDAFLCDPPLQSKRVSLRQKQSLFLASQLPTGTLYSSTELKQKWRKDLNEDKSCSLLWKQRLNALPVSLTWQIPLLLDMQKNLRNKSCALIKWLFLLFISNFSEWY